MERDRTLTFSPIHHPDPQVARIGFDLDDPYVEQCWSAVVGPSAILLLRRMPHLWMEQSPAEISAAELSRSLGLGPSAGPNSRLASTLDRVVRFKLAQVGAGVDHLEVQVEVAPLHARQLARVPEWTRAAHDRLLAEHIEQLGPNDAHRANVTELATRRLSDPAPAAHPSTGSREALGR